VNGWEPTLVRLIDDLDNGGGYGTPDEEVFGEGRRRN